MKKITLIIMYILFLFSCKKNKKMETTILENDIWSRAYNLQNNGIKKYKTSVRVMTFQFSKFFIYNTGNSNDYNDTLKIFKDKIYLNNALGSTLLKKIDTKTFNNTSINKYYYKDKRDYRGDKYLFLNKSKGLFFEESLNSGFFIEYDIKKYNEIHRAIVNKGIISNKLFKKGSYEIEFPSFYKYPELNMMDSIQEGNRWRYFIKKEK